jgi:DNA (cytosine-5)-methyltransferase 1
MFSGIGAFDLGLERAGMKIVRQIEIDPFCRAVLKKHWPDVPCDEDVTTAEFTEGEADVICGGFPCQDVSRAGKRAGITGERSGLYRELVRAIRVVRPEHAVIENVAALLGDGLDVVLGDIAEIGYDAEWDIVPACAIGAPHERERVWIVAHSNGLDRRCGEREDEEDWQESGYCIEPSSVAHVADAASARLFPSTHSGVHCCQEGAGTRHVELKRHPAPSPEPPHAKVLGCGQGRSRRPPDRFARVRDEARRNAADPYGARLAFREGFTRDAWEKLTATERDGFGNVGQQIWPDEPALSGVDDGVADWVERTKATGNCLLPQIPELIGRAILAATPEQGRVG